MNLARIDIQYCVQQLRWEPQEEDEWKLEHLRSHLGPLLADLNHLQVASDVYLCGELLNSHNDVSLELWDMVADSTEEVLTGAELSAANQSPIVANRLVPIESSHPPLSVSTEGLLPVELQIIGLPSNRNVTGGYDNIELMLRKTQAKTHLNHLHKLIAEKSFHYSDLIQGAPRKGVITKARGMLRAINHWISFHCQVYSQC